MPSLEELLAEQLLQKKIALQARNPFSIAGQAISGTDFSGAFDPKDAWKASLLQNLVGGFATGVGQRQTDTEFGDLASRLSKAYDSPNAVEAMRQQADLGEFAGLARMIEAKRAGDTAERLKELQATATLQAPLLAERFPEVYGNPFGAAQKSQIWIDPDIPQDPDTQAALQNALQSEAGGYAGPSGGGSFEDKVVDIMGLGATANAALEYLQNQSGDKGSKYPTMQPLTPEQKQQWGEDLGIPPEERDIRLATRGDADREMAMKRLTGQNTRPISGEELKQINANDFFRKVRINKLQELAKKLDDNSLVRATKGGKLVSWFGDTKSPEWKFYSELKAAQQEYARSKDAGALSVFDVNIWGPLFEGLPLLEDASAIRDRINSIDSDMSKAKSLMLDNLKNGGVNIFGLGKETTPKGEYLGKDPATGLDIYRKAR